MGADSRNLKVVGNRLQSTRTRLFAMEADTRREPAGRNFGHPGILGCMISACSVAGTILQRDLRQEILAGCRR